MKRHRDPTDEWLYVEPLTDEQLKADRDLVIRRNSEFVKYDVNQVYTCDNCVLANRCSLAFDIYNTNGDCLLSK